MVTEVNFPFQGDVFYDEESTYLDGVTGTCSRFSDAVMVCRIESGDVNAKLRTIADSRVTDFSANNINPQLHLEFVWQPTTENKLSDWITRTAGDIKSFGIGVRSSQDRGTSSDFHCKGVKCDTLNVASTTGENYIVTMDCSVGSVVTSEATSDTPAAVGTEYAAFNRAGSITWDGIPSYYVTKG